VHGAFCLLKGQGRGWMPAKCKAYN
jgi:hypothetical protein